MREDCDSRKRDGNGETVALCIFAERLRIGGKEKEPYESLCQESTIL